jgi:hypothetical protein
MHHIILYFIGDLAFLFLTILIVTFFLEKILADREKRAILVKLNMVIGTFFSEVGFDLLKLLSTFDNDLLRVREMLMIKKDWSDQDFVKAKKSLRTHASNLDSRKGNLKELKIFLVGKRQFLLVLMENPNLLEHEYFTNLLWAVFHLTDELGHRVDTTKLPETDLNHLSGDIKRAYHELILQWLDYVKHLKHDYPYLFSLALRKNPFDPSVSIEVLQ